MPIHLRGLAYLLHSCLHVLMHICVPVPSSPHPHTHAHPHTHTSPHAQDVVTRYAHQNGFHVERRFGWDCHGLPVEYEIDKTLGIKVRREGDRVMSTINRQCRQTTMFMCVAVSLDYTGWSVPQGPEDVEKMGVAAYNAECRKIVMRYSQEWEVSVA